VFALSACWMFDLVDSDSCWCCGHVSDGFHTDSFASGKQVDGEIDQASALVERDTDLVLPDHPGSILPSLPTLDCECVEEFLQHWRHDNQAPGPRWFTGGQFLHNAPPMQS
jgi:hypothetical protein